MVRAFLARIRVFFSIPPLILFFPPNFLSEDFSFCPLLTNPIGPAGKTLLEGVLPKLPWGFPPFEAVPPSIQGARLRICDFFL